MKCPVGHCRAASCTVDAANCIHARSPEQDVDCSPATGVITQSGDSFSFSSIEPLNNLLAHSKFRISKSILSFTNCVRSETSNLFVFEQTFDHLPEFKNADNEFAFLVGTINANVRRFVTAMSFMFIFGHDQLRGDGLHEYFHGIRCGEKQSSLDHKTRLTLVLMYTGDQTQSHIGFDWATDTSPKPDQAPPCASLLRNLIKLFIRINGHGEHHIINPAKACVIDQRFVIRRIVNEFVKSHVVQSL